MKQKDPASQPQQRAIQYWYTDGIFEIGFGLLCLALGGYFSLSNILQGNRFAFLVDIALVVVVIGGSFLMRWLVQKWKERVTFPRTGYVSYARKPSRGWTMLVGLILFGALGTMVIVLSYLYVRFSAWPLLTGILFCIVMVLMGRRTSLRRFYLHAVLSLLAGVGLAFSPWDNHVNLALFYLFIGLILIISGALLLRKYLRQNPVSQEEQNEG